ncbi:MAG: hypothetical protein RLP02_13925 [Coleofasciculus sp. C2-GNP5-27]
MTQENLDSLLEQILNQYQQAFAERITPEESTEEDDMMLAFGLTQDIKATNKQYWGRQLGKCWERLVETLCQQTCEQYQKAHGTYYDLAVGLNAIDTKYRIGSGDAKTLRGFRENAQTLINEGFTPVLLILRNDNLPQAIKACSDGGWEIYAGNNAYNYLHRLT